MALEPPRLGTAGSGQVGLRGLVAIISVMTKRLSAVNDDGVMAGTWGRLLISCVM